MKIDLKTIVVILLIALITFGGYSYWKNTAQTRMYKADIEQLKLIKEHQELEIACNKLKAELESSKKKPPVIDFNPPPQKDTNK